MTTALAREQHEVSADAALALLRMLRRRGGAGALVITGILGAISLFLLLASWVSPVLMLFALPFLAGFVGMMKRGLRSEASSGQLTLCARLKGDLRAMLDDDLLLVGRAGTPQTSWEALRLSKRERHQLHQLALPEAKLLPAGGQWSRTPAEDARKIP